MVGVSPLWSSLRSFAVEGVDMVLCQVLVGLPYGAAVPLASWVRGCSYYSCWVTYLRSGRCSSSVHDRDVAFPPLVGMAFGLSAILMPQA